MGNALAIAAVTAVLKDLLNNGLIDHNVTGAVGGNVTVSALPPDRVFAPGTPEGNQLNLFLYQVAPNVGWRNVGLPSRDESGGRLTNPPLALDLHYLVTAYGAEDLHAEVLLGYAMQLLHETPVLTKQSIRTALLPSPVNGSILPPALQALSVSDLAEQVEQIKIVGTTLTSEEMSKLWTALQARYRPTAAYHISVVLIESQRAAKSALPILTIGPVDPVTREPRGPIAATNLEPQFPMLISVTVPERRMSAHLGDTLIVEGHKLDGTSLAVRLAGPRLSQPIELSIASGNTATRLETAIPNTPATLPAGLYSLAVLVQRPGETFRRTTNELTLVLAPQITTALPATFARDGNGDATITMAVRPEVQPTQRVALLLGDLEIMAQPRTNQANTVSFVVRGPTPGTYLVRVRVDGVDSVVVNRTVTPPEFFNHRVTVN
ncbi:MAG TPA: DUF4255 domain-containing protein [Nitrospiraceae bacterium]|nr:DUF4255 domain-containing protein [Nitrospiraceae bacterium]